MGIDNYLSRLFRDIIIPWYMPGGISIFPLDFPLAVFFAVRFLIYFAGGFVFYQLVSKALREEGDRRLKKQNLMYAAIAHDLKTPMTSVSGFAKALSEGRIDPADRQEVYDIISNKTDSMNEMVDTLFEYSKLGTGQYTPKMEELDLCALVRHTVAEYYTEYESHDIELDVDIPDEPVMIAGDENELKRAFANLIVNVYKHNPEGIKAKISVRSEKGKAVVRIMDSGEQILAGVNIFEPFITENSSRTAGKGSGLGLAITKKIIETHGGRVYIENGGAGYTKAFVARI